MSGVLSVPDKLFPRVFGDDVELHGLHVSPDLDTITYNAPAVKMVLDWMGPDRVIFGSDAPPLTSLKPRAIKLIRDLDIGEPERAAIFSDNAARLLKLPSAPAAGSNIGF